MRPLTTADLDARDRNGRRSAEVERLERAAIMRRIQAYADAWRGWPHPTAADRRRRNRNRRVRGESWAESVCALVLTVLAFGAWAAVLMLCAPR